MPEIQMRPARFGLRISLAAFAFFLALPASGFTAPEQPVEATARQPAQSGPDNGQAVSPAEMPALFGYPARRVFSRNTPEAAGLLKRWNEVLQRHTPEEVFGTDSTMLPGPTLAQWKNVTKRFPAMPPDEKLRVINGFFNNWSSIDDKVNYGQEEYWATPAEFYAKGGGDCEDYAIIKYLALRWFGWPENDLWLVFVMDLDRKTGHAVLAARAGERIFILDNLSRPAYLIMPHMEYSRRFVPLYSLSGQDVYMPDEERKPDFAAPKNGPGGNPQKTKAAEKQAATRANSR